MLSGISNTGLSIPPILPTVLTRVETDIRTINYYPDSNLKPSG